MRIKEIERKVEKSMKLVAGTPKVHLEYRSREVKLIEHLKDYYIFTKNNRKW